jgi:hypothetical protein
MQMVLLLAASLLVSESALAAKWKVTLNRVSVAATKPGGAPWDADGSAPDTAGIFLVGTVNSETGACTTSKIKRFEKHQDTHELQPAWGTIIEAESPAALCIRAEFWDVDVMFDDPISNGVAKLSETLSPRFGPLSLEVSVEPVQTSAPSAVPIALPGLRPPRPDALCLVTVVKARIHGQKPDGLSWDEPSDPEAQRTQRTHSLLKLGLSLMTGRLLPVIRAAGEIDRDTSSHTYQARTVSAPDSRVMLRLGDLQPFKTPTEYNTFAPRWGTRFLVPPELLFTTTLTIQVADDDGEKEEAIDTEVIAGNELLQRVQQSPIVRLKFGSVEELVLQIEPVREAERPTEKSFSIDTTKGWVDTGLDLVGGQTVQIRASGEHCMADGRCLGPSGDRGGTKYSDPANPTLTVHEGELVAVIGDVVLPVGPGAQITAPTSGRLLLGVQNSAASGSIEAQAIVAYPLFTAPASAPTVVPGAVLPSGP